MRTRMLSVLQRLQSNQLGLVIRSIECRCVCLCVLKRVDRLTEVEAEQKQSRAKVVGKATGTRCGIGTFDWVDTVRDIQDLPSGRYCYNDHLTRNPIADSASRKLHIRPENRNNEIHENMYRKLI